MPKQNDPVDGKFWRKHELWTPQSWDDGYFDSDGRFRVYRPDYPRAYHEGYALRSHVVWWLSTGTEHPTGTKLHHINEDRTDDRLENLANVTAEAHVKIHCSVSLVTFICEVCKKEFGLLPWRVRQREKEGNKIRFCSWTCTKKKKLSPEHRLNISLGLRRHREEERNDSA